METDGMKAISELLKLEAPQIQWRDGEIEEWERAQAERRKSAWHRRQVPERYWNERISTYNARTEEQRNAKAKAESFVQAARRGKFQTLLLLGSPGTGKTHLACGIVYECGGLYRQSSAVCAELRRAKSFSASRTEEEILDGYGSAGLLVIDEIGRGSSADEERNALYQIINGRYNRRRPTVLVSNLGKKDFLSYAGIACADRLTESAQVVELSGQSYRGEIRRKGYDQ